MEEFSATFSSQAEQVDNIVVDMNVIKNNSEEATNEMSQNLNKIDETTQRTIEGQHKLNNIKNDTQREHGEDSRLASQILLRLSAGDKVKFVPQDSQDVKTADSESKEVV